MATASDWNTVDIDTLSADTLALYQASKEAYKAYKVARDAFQAAMQADYAEHVPQGQELKFGYNFGKLSIAIGPATAKKAKIGTKQTLAEWLAEQARGL